MKQSIILNTAFFGFAFALLALTLPSVAGAQLDDGNAGGFGTFVTGLTDLVNNFLIPFLIALAVLAFIYGVFQYFIAGGADEEKRAAGRQLMLYALIGFVAIVALWGIVNFLVDALGFESSQGTQNNFPQGPGTGAGG